jgi:hypothetical protein
LQNPGRLDEIRINGNPTEKALLFKVILQFRKDSVIRCIDMAMVESNLV